MNRRQWLSITWLAMALSVFSWATGSTWAAVPMPDPGGTPDYYTTPNWANSPPLRKFVDTLPGLTAAGTNSLGQYIPVAIPDTTTYPGSDYYEIEVGQYSEQMHSDLPPTPLQGYRQTNTADATVNTFHYLGPLIVATKDRPVRIKFKNALTPNSALFVPVDTTVMGSGPFEIDYDPVTKAPMPLTRGDFAQNRATLHLHGGRTPWISDGTPHQWITPAGETTDYPKGVSVAYVPDMWFDGSGNTITDCAAQTTCGTAGATNDPGPGAQTFYWTNQQSARLMFYHDHAWGITRLNVYVGEAAGYLLNEPAMDTLLAGVLPADQIPLIIQDKTFVDEDTITITDPTWNWGSRPGWAVKGDLWWPHVYMPAQNPYNPDMSGVNAFGRWHYGPWFWPPTPLCGSAPNAVVPFCITNGPVPNPLYDQGCDPALTPTGFCQPPENPGTPNPSWGAEAFLDTPIVNGTAYPKLTVQPKSYRLRVLNAAHDRFLNLQFYEADGSQTNPDCPTCASNTEVKMVPASPRSDCSATLNTNCVCVAGFSPAGCFPATWPTDGREGGVPDPAMAGPEWIQIGTEGGFLPQPVVLPNQPVTWNLDPTMFNVGNVDGGTLILGPAERADVIIDFSQYAGKTLILYNDAPTAFPALDPHYDYYTGDPDRTDIGGSPSTPVGLGPNVRTIMQIQVAATTPDAAYDVAALQAKFTSTTTTPGVFEQGQAPVIVGQTAYDSTYISTTNNAPFPATWPNWGKSRISDTTISFQQPDGTLVSDFPMKPKAIHDEMGGTFDDFGRMSAKLGLEVPSSNAAVSSFVLQNYVDPATEIVGNDEVQIWKITHNGVDTHPIHFHLFEVQLLNRVGWDGFIRDPDANELGWKDTVRMAPLEDTIVALRAVVPTVPFRLPDSIRPLNPSLPLNVTESFTNLGPTGQRFVPAIKNELYNFGWEYVWHCHILSHEENDMMRPIVGVVIEPPSGLLVVPSNLVGLQLTWTDNSHNETGFTVQRSTNAAFTQNLVSFADQPASVPNSVFGQTLNLTDATAVSGIRYYYRVQAVNDYGSATRPNIFASAWSAPVFSSGKAMGLTPGTLSFANQLLNTPSATQNITVTNSGNADITIAGVTIGGAAAAQFRQTNTCVGGGALAPAATCTVTVAYQPTNTGLANASITVHETTPVISQTATLSGTGVSAVASVSPLTRAFGNQVITTPSTAQTVTVRNSGTAPLTISTIGLTGANGAEFSQANTCGALPRVLAQAASCTISLTFTPAGLGAKSAGLTVDGALVSLTGTGIDGPETAVAPTALSFGNQVLTTTSAAQTVTLSNPGNQPLTINSISLAGTNPGRFARTTTCGATLAAGANCTVSVVFTPTVAAAQSALLNVSVAAPATSRSIALSGAGIVGPIASVSPATVAFANQVLNTTSTAQTVTVSNTGSASMTINGIILTGADSVQFAQTNTCGPTLAAGANCTVSLTFTPTVANSALSAALEVNVASPATSSSVSLSGTGDTPLPAAAVSRATLPFADQMLSTTSAAQTVTVSNTGSGPLTINGVSLTGADLGQFAQTNDCGPTLAVGANCTVSVTFTPTVANTALNAALEVSVAAPAASQSVSLSGTGVASVAAVSSTALLFGDQLLNTTSAAQTVTVSNTGTGPLTINSIGLVGANQAHFAQASTCGATLAAGANCTVSVTFTPAVANTPLSALLNVDVAAPGALQSVDLSGTGTLPVAELSAASLSFGNQGIYTISSPPQTMTLSNTGTGPLTINSINLTGTDPGQFMRTSTCGGTLAAGASCTVHVRFAPMVAGTWAAALEVSVAVPGVSLSASLSGTAIAPLTTVSPATLTFGDQVLNAASTAQTVVVSNTGTAPMTINNVTLTGSNPTHFAQTNTCDATTLVAGANCTVSVTFNPTGAGGAGLQSASLTVNVAAPAANEVVSLSGTGVFAAPQAAVSPATLPFASQGLNTTSAAQTVLVSNTGSGPLTINGISLTSADFAQTNDCGVTLAVGANCTVSVTFTPTVVDTPLSAVLDVSVAAPATSQSVSLSGTGAVNLPVAAVSPATLLFVEQPTNTTSAVQTVTVTNTGNALMTINGISLTGVDLSQFAQINTCGPTLAAGANCTVSLSFTPLVAGIMSAALEVSVAAPAISQSVALNGTGVAPVAAVSPAALLFGDQLLNTTSTAQTVTVSNPGNAPLTINSIGLVGASQAHFSQISTCGATLAAGANCTVSVTFTPAVANTPLSASLTVDVAAPAALQTVDLSGTGTLPVAELSATTLPFGNQVINTISAPPQTVTLSNTGTGPLTINSFSLAGADPNQFSRATTCGGILAAGANCTINLRFAPTVVGAWTAALEVNVSAPGTSQSVSLSGTGTVPLNTVSPTTMSFGDQIVNTTSAALTVNVSNTGSAPMTINNVTLAGASSTQFAQTNTCAAATLAAGANCTVSVTFKPTGTGGVGLQSASLTVNAAAPAASEVVSLSGTGINAPVSAVLPATLAFGNQLLNTTSAARTVTVSNTGSAPMTISSLDLVGLNPTQFAQTTTCGATLAAGTNCTVSLTFKPTATVGAQTATLTVNVAAPALSKTVALNGTTTTAPASAVLPATLAFGNQLLNTTSAARIVTVSNTGSAPMTISSIGLAGLNPTQFAQTTTCGATLDAGANCTVSLTFSPTATTGTRAATLTVNVAAPALSKSVALSGTGTTAPASAVLPATLAFGNQVLNTTSAAQTVTVSNTGLAPMSITSIGLAGLNTTQFARTTTCGATLAAGASCTVSLTFKPTATAGARTATLTVNVAAPALSKTVALSGTATTAPASAVWPTALAFGNQVLNTTSAVRAVTVYNTGSAPMTINSIGLAGLNPTQFAQTTTCGATLAAGASCTVSVNFKPTATAGARTATLTVNVAAPAVNKSVTLSGTATTAPASAVLPATLAFSNQVLNTTSAARTVTVSNTGSAPMAISSIALAGLNPTQFARTTTCGATLAAGASCTVSVTFKPTATAGARTATLTVNVTAPALNKSVALSGTATTAPASAVLPATLAFGNQVLNTTSAARTVTVSNTGSAPMTISSIGLAGANATQFARTTTCGATLAPAAICTVSVTFKPTGLAGARNGALNVIVAAPAVNKTVTLSGFAL